MENNVFVRCIIVHVDINNNVMYNLYKEFITLKS